MDKNEITTSNTELSEILDDEYGIEISPYEGQIDKSSSSYIPVPKEIAADLSVVTSSFPTLATNAIANDSLSKTAYSISFNGKDVLPGELWQKKNGSYISNLKGESSHWGKQTDVNVIDNTAAKGAMLASSVFAVASVATSTYYLKGINNKLSNLQDITKDILTFLETDKQSKLQADMELLRDIADNIKTVKSNPESRAMKVNLLSIVQREAKANLLFYKKRVYEQLTKYTSAKRKDKKHYEQLAKDYALLQFCLQEYSVSKLLEIDLTNNYSPDKLEQTKKEIEGLSNEYKSLNRRLASGINKHYSSKIVKNIIPSVASTAVYGLGDLIQKTPVGNDSSDNKIKQLGKNGIKRVIAREERHLSKVLNDRKGTLLDPFSEKLSFMEHVCNGPVELIVDGEDAYIKINTEE